MDQCHFRILNDCTGLCVLWGNTACPFPWSFWLSNPLELKLTSRWHVIGQSGLCNPFNQLIESPHLLPVCRRQPCSSKVITSFLWSSPKTTTSMARDTATVAKTQLLWLHVRYSVLSLLFSPSLFSILALFYVLLYSLFFSFPYTPLFFSPFPSSSSPLFLFPIFSSLPPFLPFPSCLSSCCPPHTSP